MRKLFTFLLSVVVVVSVSCNQPDYYTGVVIRKNHRLISRGRHVYGVVLVKIVEYLCAGGSQRLMRAIGMCRRANDIGFEVGVKDYTELLKELRQTAKDVPLSDTAQSAITYVLGGEWEEAIHAIFKLKRERN